VVMTDPAAQDPTPDGEDIEWVDLNRPQKRAATKQFIRPRRVFLIDFASPLYEGLEVKARSVSIGSFIEIMELYAAFEGRDPEDPAALAADFPVIEKLFGWLAASIVSWNLCDPDPAGGDPIPLPITVETIKDLDPDLVFLLISGWMDAVAGVPVPLGPTSNGGAPSVEASIPMDDPSPNP